MALYAIGVLFLRLALLGLAAGGPGTSTIAQPDAPAGGRAGRAPVLTVVGLALIAIGFGLALASGQEPLLLTAFGGSVLLLLVGRPLVFGRWWAGRLSTRQAVWAQALLFAGPLLAIGLAHALSGRLESGGVIAWVAVVRIFFLGAAFIADLMLRAFAADRPKRDGE